MISVLSATASCLLPISLEDQSWALLGLPIAFVTGGATFIVVHRSRSRGRVAHPASRQLGTGRPLAAIGLLLASIILLVLINQPPLSRSREAAHRILCGSNLREIGRAMQAYRAATGSFPQDLASLGLPGTVLICPNADSDPAEPGDAVVYGLNLSYVILSDEASASGDPDVIVGIEAPHLHQRDVGSVLFADGSVRYLRSDELAVAVDELRAAGRWPFMVDPAPFRVMPNARRGSRTTTQGS
jgi:hypothetical protein